MEDLRPIKTVKAITPEEAGMRLAEREFPDFIIQAFNECIVEAKLKHSSRVYQNDVMDRALSLCDNMYTRQEIFEKRWLDVEEHFRAAGWSVSYYKPPYYDSTPAYFDFS